jgi:4-nitrophenyl phosphatase
MHRNNNKIRNLILDMDGVLWHGDTPVPGLAEFFATLSRSQINFVLATNNATKISYDYAEKFAGFGIEIAASNILTSAEATALYLKGKSPDGAVIYVIGEEGLRTALGEQGLDLIDGEGFALANTHVDYVVAGMTRHVCYKQLALASHFINKGATFVGTNPDVTFPTEIGPLPGAGSILAFIETATGIEPIVIGKPNRAVFDEAVRRLNGNPSDTVMVGDRLNTDIAGGHAAGLRTILLLSGISGRKDLADSPVQPDWVFSDLRELTGFLQAGQPVNWA